MEMSWGILVLNFSPLNSFPQPYLLELGETSPILSHQTLPWNAELNYWVWLGPEWGCKQDLISLLSFLKVDLADPEMGYLG